jgi:hypothetical protein
MVTGKAKKQFSDFTEIQKDSTFPLKEEKEQSTILFKQTDRSEMGKRNITVSLTICIIFTFSHSWEATHCSPVRLSSSLQTKESAFLKT